MTQRMVDRLVIRHVRPTGCKLLPCRSMKVSSSESTERRSFGMFMGPSLATNLAAQRAPDTSVPPDWTRTAGSSSSSNPSIPRADPRLRPERSGAAGTDGGQEFLVPPHPDHSGAPPLAEQPGTRPARNAHRSAESVAPERRHAPASANGRVPRAHRRTRPCRSGLAPLRLDREEVHESRAAVRRTNWKDAASAGPKIGQQVNSLTAARRSGTVPRAAGRSGLSSPSEQRRATPLVTRESTGAIELGRDPGHGHHSRV
jgi:hypothetical protein